jgi:hypothetical protein
MYTYILLKCTRKSLMQNKEQINKLSMMFADFYSTVSGIDGID